MTNSNPRQPSPLQTEGRPNPLQTEGHPNPQQPLPRYTANLNQGLGVIEETQKLLHSWQKGLSAPELRKKVIQEGIFPHLTSHRIDKLVGSVFAPRFLKGTPFPAEGLKLLVEKQIPLQQLNQLFFICACRSLPILHDFVLEIYWKHLKEGRTSLTKEDTLHFLEMAVTEGKIPERWSDYTMNRSATNLLGVLADFQLLSNNRHQREFRPPSMLPQVLLYLVHEMHFHGFNDNHLLESEVWMLFGLEKADLLSRLERISREGYFLFQYSGELLHITWKYKTLEEYIHEVH